MRESRASFAVFAFVSRNLKSSTGSAGMAQGKRESIGVWEEEALKHWRRETYNIERATGWPFWVDCKDAVRGEEQRWR
jgi:hypothetical protein